MEDSEQPRVARAGRRAAKAGNTWGDSAPPEPSSQGLFGNDAPSSPSKGWEASGGGGGRSGGGAGGLADLNVASSRGDDADEAPPPPRARKNEMMVDNPSPPPPARAPPPSGPKTAPADMLADDGKKFVGVSRRKAEQLKHGDEEHSRKNLKYEELTTGADGIMDIPELEDEGREDLSRVVAEAPKVRTQKVQGMEQLEEEMHFKLPPSDDRDIDLSLLTAVLCSSEQVHEPEDVWDPDIILTEVASALYSEKEKAEGEVPDKDDPNKEQPVGL